MARLVVFSFQENDLRLALIFVVVLPHFLVLFISFFL
jgi:hypothetical protein